MLSGRHFNFFGTPSGIFEGLIDIFLLQIRIKLQNFSVGMTTGD